MAVACLTLGRAPAAVDRAQPDTLTDEAHFPVLRLLAERPDASQRQLAAAPEPLGLDAAALAQASGRVDRSRPVKDGVMSVNPVAFGTSFAPA
jgi:hypothetical protein